MRKETRTVKTDTSTNWAKAVNFIPQKGDIIIYSDFAGDNYKIGDGITKVGDLPFINQQSYEYVLNDNVLIIRRK